MAAAGLGLPIVRAPTELIRLKNVGRGWPRVAA
jgi:hypothetical protein